MYQMYLARFQDRGRQRFEIRNSCYDERQGCYRYRRVFDLGEDPGRYIHRITEDLHYFDEALESAVEKELDGDPDMVLEDLLWDFLPEPARRLAGDFGRYRGVKLTSLSDIEQQEVHRHVHLFDRRRIYYIRYGAVDQSRIYRLSDKLYRPLLYKCRDEKEYYFKEMERVLPASEMKKYIFSIFDLQQRFSENHSPYMPEALDVGKMERIFVSELCRLNSDDSFWQDGGDSSFLRPHLEGYLIGFFDNDFEQPSFINEFFRTFRARHSSFKWPESRQPLSEEETSAIFGRNIGELKKMDKAELAKLFRNKAKEHHPDSGGESEKFIQLRQAYENLRKSLRS